MSYIKKKKKGVFYFNPTQKVRMNRVLFSAFIKGQIKKKESQQNKFTVRDINVVISGLSCKLLSHTQTLPT